MVDPPRGFRLLESDLPQQLVAIFTRERRAERQELVQRRSERVNVRAVIDNDAFGERLFRAHVAERTDQVAGQGQATAGVTAGVRNAGQAEIGDP